MKFDKALSEQIRYSLSRYLDSYDLSKDPINSILEELEAKDDLLGPICSCCEYSEPNVDVIDNPTGNSWWYLVNVSSRCAKTCRDYTCHQIYFDNKRRVKPEDKERFPGSLTFKMACVHFSYQKSEKA
jgi:hypothetical protein